jgi:ABC-type sugar transport system substrate-binding protein
VSASELPADRSFYDSADNYLLGWLACRLIAQRYGQPKLIALYDWFKDHQEVDGGFRAVLGTSYSAFLSAWQGYLGTLRGA